MAEYPGNSRTDREGAKRPDADKTEDKQRLESVVKNGAVRRKQGLGKRFLNTFVGGDDAKSVWQYLAQDVLVPAAKDMITDAVTQGVERMVFGDVRNRAGGSRSRGGSGYTSYNRVSTAPSRREEPRRELSRRARATHDFDEIVLVERVEAEEVIDCMYGVLEKYRSVTVADFYDLVGQSPSHVDERWGWEDLRGAAVTRVKGGWLLDLPRPIELD